MIYFEYFGVILDSLIEPMDILRIRRWLTRV